VARYDRSGQDPYTDPRTGILRNKVGATDQATLDAREVEFTTARTLELTLRPERGGFDLAHLRRIHARLFGDVYDWAGALRSVDISKGNSAFAHHGFLGSAAADVFGRLAREQHLRGLDRDAFGERAAEYLGDVNALHPFREGNGRAQRAFFGQLARAAGYRLAWEGMTREAMTGASIEAMRGENRPMAALLRAHVSEHRELDRAVPARRAEAVGIYAGLIAAVSRETVTQAVGGELVEHARSRLTGRLDSLVAGRPVVITYAGGIGRVADPQQKRARPGR